MEIHQRGYEAYQRKEVDMKIEIDQRKLEDIMHNKGIDSLKHLADKCGIPRDMLYKAYQRKSFSKECLWLISEELILYERFLC